MSATRKSVHEGRKDRASTAVTQRPDTPIPAAAANAELRPTPFWKRVLTPANVFFLVCAIVVYAGWRAPLHRYITPETGLGYALGIVGGCLMLVLLLYPARKRVRWLSFMGSVKHWFQFHMVLGVLGPICILYHSNFSTGATNSNVALICMLIVSGSGLVGRYFYSKIHHGLYGHQATLQELQNNAERLRLISSVVSFLPDLLSRIAMEEKRLLSHVESQWMIVRPFSAAWNSFTTRRSLFQSARMAMKNSASAESEQQRQRLMAMAQGYITARIRSARRIAEYQSYAQLFSLWHLLHLPLFFMLLIAGVVHVIAVHVY